LADRYGATLGGEGGSGEDLKDYWATRDPKALISALKQRRQDFLQFFDDSSYFERIHRSWGYYHGLAYDQGYGNTEVRTAGEEEELRLADINEFRAGLSLLKTYITQGQIEFDALASDGESATLQATKKANALLGAQLQSREHHLEVTMDQAVEDAIVMSSGYVWNLWDETIGPEVTADLKAKQVIRGGDIRHLNPSIFDVTFDYTVREFRDTRWLDVRRQENRHELAALFPKKADDILRLAQDSDRNYLKFDFQLGNRNNRSTDHRWVHYFYHLPTPALPRGRFLRYVGDVMLESRDELPDGHIPVHRLIPAQFLLTAFGFSPSFSAQAPQELLNAVLSTLATNHHALGSTKIWKRPNEPINRTQLEPGVTLLETDTEPKPLNLLKTPKELYDSLDIFTGMVGRMIGTNETARGAPEHNIKAAAALAFTEQRVQQAASDLVQNYDQLVSDVGTSIVQIYAARLQPEEKREFFAKSRNNRSTISHFTPEELQGVKEVGIVRGNPALRTLGGRIQVAETLLEKGAAGPDEFLTVLKTGSLDKLTESEDNQLDIIHAENDALLYAPYTAAFGDARHPESQE
jgi:hypothetical protein